MKLIERYGARLVELDNGERLTREQLLNRAGARGASALLQYLRALALDLPWPPWQPSAHWPSIEARRRGDQEIEQAIALLDSPEPLSGFAKEYLGESTLNLYSVALGLWRDYYNACEAYDRRVCTGPMSRDGIMPTDPREQGLVNRYAQEQHAIVARLAAEQHIPQDVMLRAQEAALREKLPPNRISVR